MTKVVFGNYNFQIEKNRLGGKTIFDFIRKKRVPLTPEEWVRQHVLHYLVLDKNFSKNLIAVERTIEVNGLLKRFDVLTYDREGKPFLMVECKAENVPLNEETLKQILIYNQALAVKFLWITNGWENYCFQTSRNLKLLSEVPYFEEPIL